MIGTFMFGFALGCIVGATVVGIAALVVADGVTG